MMQELTMRKNTFRAAVFLDRDGVINRMVPQEIEGYDSPASLSQVSLVDNIVPLIAWCMENDIPVIQISNQPGVAKGKLTLQELDGVQQHIENLLKVEKVALTKAYRCLHHPDASKKELRTECDCRKPKAGLLFQAAKELDIDLSRSIFIGDNVTDMEAAKKAGCAHLLYMHEEDTLQKKEKNRQFSGKKVYNHTETLEHIQAFFSLINTTAVIVAGGKGTRLKPLTDIIPKPMIRVGGIPILLHTLNLFKKYGVRNFVLALCYLPEQIKNYFGDGSLFGVSITYTLEDPNTPYGTAGAIQKSKHHLEDTFIVTYADTLRELDLLSMWHAHKAAKSVATIHAYKHKGDNHKSTLVFDEDKKLIAFEELPTSQTLNQGEFAWSNGSFYILEKAIFDYVEKNKQSDFAKNVFPSLLQNGYSISVFPHEGYFIDIGTIETLEKANNDIENNRFIP